MQKSQFSHDEAHIKMTIGSAMLILAGVTASLFFIDLFLSNDIFFALMCLGTCDQMHNVD